MVGSFAFFCLVQFSKRKNAAYSTRYVLAYIYLNSISYFIFGNYLVVVAAVAVYEIGNFYRVLLAPAINTEKHVHTQACLNYF